MTRADFDQMVLDEAVKQGATLIYGRAARPIIADDGSVCGVEAVPDDGGLVSIEAELTVDCSGQSSFPANHGVTGPKYLGNYDKQLAVFSQVANTIRDNGPDMREHHPDNTLISTSKSFVGPGSSP